MIKSEKLWDRMAKGYDEATRKFDHLHHKVVASTLPYLKGSDVVLDCGCGTGAMTLGIAQNVAEVQAVDISSKMLAIAKRKAHDLEIQNIDFIQSTIFDDRITVTKYDAILAFNVLHYFKDVQKNVKRIHELLKPEGKFISVTPCAIEKKTISSYLFSAFISFLVTVRMLPYIRFYRYVDLNGVMEQGNFRMIETQHLHGPEAHYFVVAGKF
jgi:ubiquinone/menaquinone biosynthesis C-methylase UbiE